MTRTSTPEPVSKRQVDAQADIVCAHNLTYMRGLPADAMQLIVTSPPYNIGKEYERRTALESYLEEQAACIAAAVRVLHPSGKNPNFSYTYS